MHRMVTYHIMREKNISVKIELTSSRIIILENIITSNPAFFYLANIFSPYFQSIVTMHTDHQHRIMEVRLT
jgi:hypothetical protein